MDFCAVLERVLELLQQHKWVTYRALQRRFDLDMAATPRPFMCTIDTDHLDSTTDVYQLHDG